MPDDQVEVPEEEFSSDEEFDDEDDSESSSDVDAKLVEEDVFDIEFFKCYSALKKKDEKIYNKDVKFFTEEVISSSEDDTDKSGEDGAKQEGSGRLLPLKTTSAPKMTLLDHQLNLKEDEIEEFGLERRPKIDLNEPVSKSFYEKELEEIKKSIEKVSEDVDSDSDDDLLVVKGSEAGTSKSRPRKTIDAMLDKLENDEDQDISHLKQIWSDPNKLTEEEKFLRDYIVNKRYIQNNADDDEDDDKGGFFSKNLGDMSDAEEDRQDETRKKKHQVDHRSDEKDFEKVARIPRNSTKTIRDLVEKRDKKEKRLKKLEKEKKKKKSVKDADFEDLVGDLPTKFHYRETEPNDYGLSAEELLMATDEELEKWVSLKDTIGYKSKEEEITQKRRYEQMRNDLELKKKIFKSIYGDPEPEPSPDNSSNLPKPERGNKRKRGAECEGSGLGISHEVDATQVASDQKKDNDTKQGKKKKYKKRGLSHKKFAKTGVAPDRLLAYGLSKTKLKKSKLL